MVNPLKKAIVKATEEEVRVYELESKRTWCNYDDLNVQYQEEELIMGKTIPEEDI